MCEKTVVWMAVKRWRVSTRMPEAESISQSRLYSEQAIGKIATGLLELGEEPLILEVYRQFPEHIPLPLFVSVGVGRASLRYGLKSLLPQ